MLTLLVRVVVMNGNGVLNNAFDEAGCDDDLISSRRATTIVVVYPCIVVAETAAYEWACIIHRPNSDQNAIVVACGAPAILAGSNRNQVTTF